MEVGSDLGFTWFGGVSLGDPMRKVVLFGGWNMPTLRKVLCSALDYCGVRKAFPGTFSVETFLLDSTTHAHIGTM